MVPVYPIQFTTVFYISNACYKINLTFFKVKRLSDGILLCMHMYHNISLKWFNACTCLCTVSKEYVDKYTILVLTKNFESTT